MAIGVFHKVCAISPQDASTARKIPPLHALLKGGQKRLEESRWTDVCNSGIASPLDDLATLFNIVLFRFISLFYSFYLNACEHISEMENMKKR